MASPDRKLASSTSSNMDLAYSIFKRHDKDGNCSIDRTEAGALIDEFCQALCLDLAARERETLLNNQFNTADANGDGRLSYDEFNEFAAYLDSIASALSGSVDAGGGVDSVKVERGTGKRRLLDASGSANMALFWKYDVNNDHKLDVNEAVELLKAVCADNDLTTNWITPKMIAAQFRAAVGDSTPRNSEDQEVTLTQEQFQAFCKTIVNFMSHLGGTTMSDMPVPVLRGDTATREIEAEGDQSVGDPPARKGGCGCFG